MGYSAEKAFETIYSILGPVFSLEKLTEFIQSFRGKPIIIHEFRLPVGLNGFVISLIDVYLIGFRRNIDKQRKEITILHELSHIYMKHVRELDFLYKSVSEESLNDFVLCHDISGNCYDNPIERETEILGTKLFAITQLYNQLGGDGLPNISIGYENI